MTFFISIILFSLDIQTFMKNSTEFSEYLNENNNLTEKENSEILNSKVDAKAVSNMLHYITVKNSNCF